MNAFFAMRSAGGGIGPSPPPPVGDLTWLEGWILLPSGDSTTVGVGTPSGHEGYPEQMVASLAALGITISLTNCGVSSATTGGINGSDTSVMDPLIVTGSKVLHIYSAGGNDVYLYNDVAGAIAGNWTGLDDRRTRAASVGAQIISICMPPFDRGLAGAVGPPSPAGQNRADFRTSMESLRAGLRSGFATHADYLFDTAEDASLLCTDSVLCNDDETHWKVPGYGRIDDFVLGKLAFIVP
jgi:hypothetical protein